MKRTTLLTAALAIAVLFAVASPALANRDPGMGGMYGPTPPRVGQAGIGGQYTDGMNLYQYCKSSPAVHRDPSGLTVVIPTFDDGPVAADYRNPAPGNCPQSQAAALSDLDTLLGTLAQRNVKAVFYVAYVNKCCPGVDMKKAFQDGVRKISAAGHVVGLHAYNHDLYKGKLLPGGSIFGVGPDAAGNDLNELIKLIREAGVEPTMVWRTPYGSHSLDQSIVAGNSIATHKWSIDSEDWYYHWDNDLWGAGSYRGDSDAAKKKWEDNVIDHLKSGVFWSGGDGDPWADILFHVNRRTPGSIGTFMDTVKNEYGNVYKGRWSDTPAPGTNKFYWLQSLDDPDFKKYLAP